MPDGLSRVHAYSISNYDPEKDIISITDIEGANVLNWNYKLTEFLRLYSPTIKTWDFKEDEKTVVEIK
jgi:hypothetical protein